MSWTGKIYLKRNRVTFIVAVALVLLLSGLAIAKDSIFKIFAFPESGSGSLHITLEQTNSGMGGANFLKDGAPISASGSWSGHVYNIENLPFGEYQIQMGIPGVPSNPVPCFGPWYSLSHHSTNQSFTYPPFDCSLTGRTPTPSPSPLKTSSPTIPQYKITGNVKGRNPNGQGGSDLLATAKIELVEKNPDQTFTYATVITSSGTYSGKNYLSNKFGANTLDHAYLEFSAPGFQPLELKLNDVSNTTLVGEGNVTYTLKTIEDVILVQNTGKMDIQGLITDDKGAFVPGVKVTISCPTYPTNMLEPCKPKLLYPNYPHNSSRSDPQSTHRNRQNYFVANVYDFYYETSFDNITIGVLPPAGYYVDADKNGEQGSYEDTGKEAYVTIHKSDIKSENVVGSNTYTLRDIRVLPAPAAPSVSVKGKLYKLASDRSTKVGIKGLVEIKKPSGDSVITVSTNDDGTYEAKFLVSALDSSNPTFVARGKYTIYESVTDRNIDFTGCSNGTGYPRQMLSDGCAGLHITLTPLAQISSFDNIDILIPMSSIASPYTLITGYVRDASTKKPIEGAFVSLKKGDDYLETAPAKTDIRGYYELIANLPGAGETNRYQVKAIKTGYSDDSAAIKPLFMSWGKIFQANFLLNKCP